MAKKRIVLTGGGTVGHVTLNLVLIPMLLADGWEVHYVGDKKGVEYERVQALSNQVHFHSIATGKLRRYFSLQNLLDFFKVGWGLLQSLVLLLRLRPKAVFSKGGFVSVPPVVAAGFLRIPVFIHESDLSMGLANRIAFKFASLMYTTFDQGHAQAKVKPIGAVTKVSKDQPAPWSTTLQEIQTNLDPAKPTVLFVGGSAGAAVFNRFVSDNEGLLDRVNIINITGDSSLNQLRQGLYRVDYVTEDYQGLLSLADVVVTRGGSNTLFELVALDKLHLIVPLVKGSRGDQVENAQYFKEKGYAQVLGEDDLTATNLMVMVKDLQDHAKSYHAAMQASQELTSPEAFYHELMAAIANKQG